MRPLAPAARCQAPSRQPGGRKFGRLFEALSVLAMATLIGLLAPILGNAQTPWQLRVVFNNDFPADNEAIDDFYTFGTRVEVYRGDWTVRFDEAAFTDRGDRLRFDETYLTVGVQLPRDPQTGFTVRAEAGLAHVGRGLIGEDVQNAVHQITGDYPVHLSYLPDADDLHFHVGAELGRQWTLADDWTWGPQARIATTIGFRSDAFAGLRAIWKPTTRFELGLTVGSHWAESELAILKPHLKGQAFADQAEAHLPRNFVIEWSRNRYGTGRDHVSIGYTFSSRRKPRSSQALGPAQSNSQRSTGR